MLTDYTDAPTIRALLGVNDLEIDDDTILLPAYEFVISEGLLDLGSSVPVMYTTVAALVSRTATQARYYEQVRLYSAALAAQALLPTLPMAVPKKLSDSKATLERVDDPYTRLEASLQALLSAMRAKILETLVLLDSGATVSATTVRVFAGVVGLGTDPITGV